MMERSSRAAVGHPVSLPTGGLRELVNIGHRGASAHAPEHTIAAYDLALAYGAHYIELDVHMTGDGALVVLHDESVDRTARVPEGACHGLIASKSLEELRNLDVGSWFNELNPGGTGGFTALRIPTLDEVLARYRHCIKFCIELKSAETGGAAEHELLRLLRAHSLHEPKNAAWRVLLLSFDPSSLERIHRLHPQLPLVQVFGETVTSQSVSTQLHSVRAYAGGIAPCKDSVDAALVDAAHGHALLVHPYTVNDSEEMTRLLALGVDGMITDFPDRLDAIVWAQALGARRS